MADKDLHDIKIDDLDSPPKTPLKNILTLLALLFIILVISVVITKLILNTDDTENTEGNLSTVSSSLTQSSDENEANSSETTTSESSSNLLPAAAIAATAAAATVAVVKNEPKERNVSGSKIKVPLRTHTPPSAVKELPKPKATPIPKKPKPVVTQTPTKVKESSKQYIDKVVASNSKSSTSSSNRSVEGQARAGVYIKVGTFKDTTNAINKIKKTGLNYILIKTKDDKTITRVLIGPFKSNWAADRHLASVQHNIAKGAYITRIK